MRPGKRCDALQTLLAELVDPEASFDLSRDRRALITTLASILEDGGAGDTCEVVTPLGGHQNTMSAERPRDLAEWRHAPSALPADASEAPELSAALSCIGRRIHGPDGLRGRLRDLSFDARTHEIQYALVGVDGLFGFSERLIVLSWRLLKYDAGRQTFSAPLTRADVRRARTLTPTDLRALGVARLSRRLRTPVDDSDFAAAAY